MITLTASNLPVDAVDFTDVVDIDVDMDLALAGDAGPALPPFSAPLFPLEPTPQVTQMEPTPPQVIQIRFDLDGPVLAEPASQIAQTYVQLDPPVLIDPLPPQVTQAIVDLVDDRAVDAADMV